VIDVGSTNGTTLNDSPEPLPPNEPTLLADGDRIHVGAWTTILITRHSAGARPEEPQS
jgi:pSer/pThr/pTyr-binding forkhead associated (FHA) protein